MTVTEGNSGTTLATFTDHPLRRRRRRRRPSSGRPPTAPPRAGSDYVAVAPTTVSFAAGETTKTVTVTVNGDTAVRGQRDVLSSGSARRSAPPSSTATGLGTITNDDAATFSVNDVTVTEGNSGTKAATFTITRSGDIAGAATVQWATADGTATAGSRLRGRAPTTVTFAAGETTKTVTVTVNGDTAVEANETFSVRLTTPTGATIADTPHRHHHQRRLRLRP